MTNQLAGKSKMVFLTLAIALTMLMGMTSWASRGLVQGQTLSLKEAQDLVKNGEGDFPVVVNEEVLTQLNKYLGTAEGRAYFQDALKRQKEFKAIIDEKTKEYKTPFDLNAIPIVESGYKNRVANGRVHAAGLWMFIPATARTFGLKVDKQIDERLNVAKETDAAQRYLLANKYVFNDWALSVLAYNVGETAVKKGIEKFQTRDPWILIKNGVEGDKNYLSNVMAAMIIMRHPDLISK